MSIWKSPVFYVGVLLVALITAALVAPFVVNWNGTRDSLESYGRKLTGRDLAINGHISARLFPWPRLVVEDVSLGNPKGIAGPPMMTAKSIGMQLNLAGLLSGDIKVETIEVDHPVVNLVRLTNGKFNWEFEPDQTIRESKLLDYVKLEQITVAGGELNLKDQAHTFATTLTDINSTISASDFTGPWRLRGSARASDMPLAISFSSGVYKTGDPFKFGFRLEPQDGSMPALIFDGDFSKDLLKGKILLEPVVTADGKQSLDGKIKPLKLKSDVEATFNGFKLDAIQITPADTKDNGTLIEGNAAVAFDNGVKAKVTLNSPRLDLDALAGSQSLRVWRAGGIMAVLNSVMKDFPEKLDLTANLDVATISAAGQTLENLSLKAAAEQNAIRINDLSANLPGRSRMKFNGIVFPGESAAELGGSLALESNDARQFVSWLWPEGKSQIADVWTGNRGRLKAQTDLTWSDRRFGFQDLRYELDGERGSAELAVQLGKLSAIDLKLKSKSLNLDEYLAGGRAHVLQGSSILALLQSDGGFDKRLAANIDTLHINGVEARNVAVDFNSGLSGFELKRLDIGSVEGASLRAQGLVLQGPDGPSGDLKATLTAENPRGFLHLIGATAKGVDPAWTDVLGATTMQANFSVKAGPKEPLVTYDVAGQSGPLQISLSGDVQDIAQGANAAYGVASEVYAAKSADFLRLFGVRGNNFEGRPGKLVLTTRGSQVTGFKSVVTADVFGAKVEFDGRYKGAAALPEITGKFNLSSEDGSELGKAIGLPLRANIAGALALSAEIAPLDGGLHVGAITGLLSRHIISGQADVDSAGKMNLDLNFNELDLRDALAISFMPWQGGTSSLDDAFSRGPNLFEGVVWLHPDSLKTGIGQDLKEAVLGLAFDGKGRQFTLAARSADAEPFKLDVTVRPKNSIFVANGTLHLPVELGRVLKLQDGTALAQGTAIFDGAFHGQGRSPMAVLSSLSSDAKYVLRDAVLTRLSPHSFFAALENVKNADDLKLAFESLQKPPGTGLTAQELPLTVQNGTLKFEPLLMTAADADVTVNPSFDFATGDFETRVDIIAKPEKDLPLMQVTYSGGLGQLRQRTDTAAVASKLGYAFMARDLAELERVQKEQEKIATDELAQQKIDETKFAAFQAQRNELRLRLREQKIFAAQRLIDAEKLKSELARSLTEGAAINQLEIAKFLRELEATSP